MLKNSIIALILSIAAVLLLREISVALHYLYLSHSFVSEQLHKIFAGGTTGNIIRNTVSLFIIPFVIALIPAGIYWAITRKNFEYFPHLLWIVWIVLATTLAIAK